MVVCTYKLNFAYSHSREKVKIRYVKRRLLYIDSGRSRPKGP